MTLKLAWRKGREKTGGKEDGGKEERGREAEGGEAERGEAEGGEEKREGKGGEESHDVISPHCHMAFPGSFPGSVYTNNLL